MGINVSRSIYFMLSIVFKLRSETKVDNITVQTKAINICIYIYIFTNTCCKF